MRLRPHPEYVFTLGAGLALLAMGAILERGQTQLIFAGLLLVVSIPIFLTLAKSRRLLRASVSLRKGAGFLPVVAITPFQKFSLWGYRYLRVRLPDETAEIPLSFKGAATLLVPTQPTEVVLQEREFQSSWMCSHLPWIAGAVFLAVAVIGTALGFILAFAPLLGWVVFFRPFLYIGVVTPSAVSITEQGIRFGSESVRFEEIDGLTAVGHDTTDYLLVHAGKRTIRLDGCLEPFNQLEELLIRGLAKKGMHPYLKL